MDGGGRAFAAERNDVHAQALANAAAQADADADADADAGTDAGTDGGCVVVERHDAWAVVRIARAAKRNALDRRTRAALLQALERLAENARCIVLTGTAGSFCAGLDIKERARERASGVADTAGAEWVELNMAIRRHPAIFIAAVNGVALGGGVTLINSCDLAIAARDASIGCPELAAGAYASAAGPTAMLSLPRKRAAWLLLTAERIDAYTAERWGLVNEVVPTETLLPRARALAARIAAFDAVAIAETKKSLDHVPAQVPDWEGALRYGQTVSAAIRAQQAHTPQAHTPQAHTPQAHTPQAHTEQAHTQQVNTQQANTE
jgi:enoyl-CoA hydratase/carnithine racemase